MLNNGYVASRLKSLLQQLHGRKN